MAADLTRETIAAEIAHREAHRLPQDLRGRPISDIDALSILFLTCSFLRYLIPAVAL